MTQLDLFNPTAPQQQQSSQRKKIVLRDYQAESVDAVFSEFESVSSTLVCLPTGCGKSVVFSAVMARWAKEHS